MKRLEPKSSRLPLGETSGDKDPLNGPEALADILRTVSRETKDCLSIYVDLVERWQKAQNLVAPSTLPHLWRRHVADSAQVWTLLPEARNWVDFGSGAGFPGLVTAILQKQASAEDGVARHVHLIESNQRKVAFLRTVIRETGCSATVYPGRIEEIVKDWSEPIDGVSARALANLTMLCGFAAPFIQNGATAIFHKGKNFREEINEASHIWSMDLLERKSLIDPDSRLLVISKLTARPVSAKG